MKISDTRYLKNNPSIFMGKIKTLLLGTVKKSSAQTKGGQTKINFNVHLIFVTFRFSRVFFLKYWWTIFFKKYSWQGLDKFAMINYVIK